MGLAVIVAALLLNYAIHRDEVADNNGPAPTATTAPAETPAVPPAAPSAPGGQSTASTGGATSGGAVSGAPAPVPSTGSTSGTTPGATPPPPGQPGAVIPSFDIVRVNPDGGMVIAR